MNIVLGSFIIFFGIGSISMIIVNIISEAFEKNEEKISVCWFIFPLACLFLAGILLLIFIIMAIFKFGLWVMTVL